MKLIENYLKINIGIISYFFQNYKSFKNKKIITIINKLSYHFVLGGV